MESMTKATATRNIQKYLRRLSYEYPSIPRPPLDGIFDTATEDSLKAFQELYGFSPTGRADKETFDTLFLAYSAALRASKRDQILDLFPSTPLGYAIDIGEESITVSVLQLLLGDLTAIFDTLEFREATGVYDESTAENIRRFQRLAKLPVTGKVDLLTWNRLLKEFSNADSAQNTNTTLQGKAF